MNEMTTIDKNNEVPNYLKQQGYTEPNENFPKYIKYGDAVCILIGWNYCNFPSFSECAKYVGYNKKKQTVVLLINYTLPFYNTKYYVDFMVIHENIISEHLTRIAPEEFYENAKGRYSIKYRMIALEDMKKNNVFLKWDI